MIGDYRVLRRLGQGGMGVVYLAEDVRLRRLAALKWLAREYADDPWRRQRFLKEARAAAALAHAGVTAVYELKESGEDLVIVFEYVEGVTLRTMVRNGGVDCEELLKIGVQIAAALEAAHARGIVHLDLKPENVMRRPNGEIKVLDFGLARIDAGAFDSGSTTRSLELSCAGMVVGTVVYMSPEQLEGKPTDFRSDIFSFGVMLYELATGSHPFTAGTRASIIANVMTVDPPPLSTINPLIPPELDRILRKCLRKLRDERYHSTRDLLLDLENLKDVSGKSRAAAPQPIASGAQLAYSWWLMHSVLYLIVGIPVLAYIGWRLHDLAPPFGLVVFLAQALLLSLEASFRVLGLSVWGWNHTELSGVWERVRRPLLYAGFGIAATMLAQAAMLLIKDEPGGAALLGVFGMGALASAAFIEPAIAPPGNRS